MEDSGLPAPVASLIARHIHSVEQLEILLLLARTAERPWTASAVSYELRISSVSAAGRLRDLAVRGLVGEQAGAELLYQYRPGAPEDRAVRALAEAYATRRVSVISAIFSRPPDAVSAFADAFRIARKKGDGRG